MSESLKKKILNFSLFAIVPVVAFYCMEFYLFNPFENIRQMAQVFNILIFELIAWGLFLLIGKARFAMMAELFLAMVFGLINHYVMEFRSTPFVPWDIFSMKTAASVVGNYEFTFEFDVLAITLLFLAGMFVCFFWDFELQIKWQPRLAMATAVVVGLCLFVTALWDEDFQTNNNLYPFLFTPTHMTKVNGMTVTFAMNLAYMTVEKPAGYQADEASEVLATFEDEKEAQSYPNIIVVMDEAFSDLAVLGNFMTNEDYMPYMHSLQEGKEDTVTGTLHVSVCGGNTANSEFEFLTGHSMAFLPNGSIPYQQYIKGEIPSLASQLKDLGYATYAQHPFNATGWSRDKVYPWMGFDEFASLKNYAGVTYLRDYVSDKSSFDMIIKTFEAKEEGQPVFIFNVTMQNHGGYSESAYNFKEEISALDKNSEVLDRYLSLMRVTDRELERLIKYFEAVEEDTLIVFFGDHQPNNAVARHISGSSEEATNRYEVPYVIWANYDIEEETDLDCSLNYLSAIALKKAGLPTSAYQNFLLQMWEKEPVISAVQTGEDWEDQELLATYKKLQYYQLFDWKE